MTEGKHNEDDIELIEKDIIERVENGQITRDNAKIVLQTLEDLNAQYPGQTNNTIERIKWLFEKKGLL